MLAAQAADRIYVASDSLTCAGDRIIPPARPKFVTIGGWVIGWSGALMYTQAYLDGLERAHKDGKDLGSREVHRDVQKYVADLATSLTPPDHVELEAVMAKGTSLLRLSENEMPLDWPVAAIGSGAEIGWYLMRDHIKTQVWVGGPQPLVKILREASTVYPSVGPPFFWTDTKTGNIRRTE